MVMRQSLFEQRLEENMEDPEFRANYQREMREIAQVQDLLACVDAAREELGLSKTGLARATRNHPAAIRKLLTSGEGNPTLRSFLSMLDATGLELKLVKRHYAPVSTRGVVARPVPSASSRKPRGQQRLTAAAV